MLKLDLKKDMKELYGRPPTKEAVLVEVPTLNYLMVDGAGDPNTAPAYKEAVETLYSLSYTLKFALKKGPEELDYTVGPLEGLWWVDDMADFSVDLKGDWKWTMLIVQPEQVTPALFEESKAEAVKKKGLAGLDKVRLESLTEGLCAQIMHLGPYSAEKPTIARLHDFIEERGYQRRGKHHEIYLGDPRRTAPEKLRTVIRQPVAS